MSITLPNLQQCVTMTNLTKLRGKCKRLFLPINGNDTTPAKSIAFYTEFFDLLSNMKPIYCTGNLHISH